MEKETVVYDIAIIGAGPAGLTATIYSARKQLSTLLLSMDIGGQVAWTSEIENYSGYQLITGDELTKKFEDQVKQFPVDVVTDNEAKSIKKDGEIFEITSKDNKKFKSRTIIVATGKRSRPLNVPKEKDFVGKGVSYCSICDAPLFKGKTVAVIGGGNSAFTAANDLINIAEKFYVINNADKWQADSVLVESVSQSNKFIPKISFKVIELIGDKRLEKIKIESLKTKESEVLPVDGVFIEIGLIPNSEFVEGFLELNKWHEIAVDDHCKTSVEGVFAAGDVTTVPEKQIIIAAGEGAKAALSAYKYLLTNKLIEPKDQEGGY